MPRIRLDLPPTFLFSTLIPIRITDINYGGHLGNDSFLTLMHEARVQFLAHYGYTEISIEGESIIMADAAIVYRSEAHYGQQVLVEVAVQDFSTFGCDLIYRLSDHSSGREIARAKTGIVFFDYKKRKPVEVPPRFRERIEATRSSIV
ncbi:MAG: thioesterase [Ignavibacteria bacterium]|nr:thioesterase [Ignavibacteria bacterium]